MTRGRILAGGAAMGAAVAAVLVLSIAIARDLVPPETRSATHPISPGAQAAVTAASPGQTIEATLPLQATQSSQVQQAPGSPTPASVLAPGGLVVPDGPPLGSSSAYVAPALAAPLANLDPGLASRGPRPTLHQLESIYQYGNPFVMFGRGAPDSDWRLAHPSSGAVRGYADDVSVVPGSSVGLHLAGYDQAARIDIFRMGRGDGVHVAAVDWVRISPQPEARPDPTTGLVEEHWPVTVQLRVPSDWVSGVYLLKLTGTSGGQSYIVLVVRPAHPTGLLFVLPTMTYQAYNDFGGTDLYGWSGRLKPRASVVSFDRPYLRGWGAGLFFRLDFPLIVWLEDHGYQPGYVTDVDIARTPSIVQGARTIVFSGHSEYWTGGMRDTVEAASNNGTNLAFFGANQAFWQSRLVGDSTGHPDRAVLCYKSAAQDPIALSDPAAATTRFGDPPVNRPSTTLIGQKYGGIVRGLLPMVVSDGITRFAPDLGLVPGQRLPGLIGEEVDEVHQAFRGVLLTSTPITVTEHPGTVTVGVSLWARPGGGRVFDAGTFDFSWGLDPRYASALPGFPGNAFSSLTAEILAWLGTQPA